MKRGRRLRCRSRFALFCHPGMSALRSKSGDSRHRTDVVKASVLTQCMVRPCVARGFRRAGGSGLASMYPAFDWSVVLLAIMGISARATHYPTGLDGPLGHQCSHAPGRPILHLVSSSRRPRRVRCIDWLRHRGLLIFARPAASSVGMRIKQSWAATPATFLASKARP